MISSLSSFLPPVLYDRLIRLRKNKLYWEGDYPDWTAASARATGYDEQSILDKTARSVQEVLAGKASFERDSVAFQHQEINHAVAAHILRFAQDTNTPLSICDFGGALGSTYLQHRKFFAQIPMEWSVIEQAHFIRYAQTHIHVDHLHFYEDLKSFAAQQKPQILLLSSVLSYLPDPWALLDEMLSLDFEHILIDKTPIQLGRESRLTVQHVPASIYKASYPCWFLSEDVLKAKLKDYELIDEYEVPMVCNLGLPHKGYAFKRR